MKKKLLVTAAVLGLALQGWAAQVTMYNGTSPGEYQAKPLGDFAWVLDNYAAAAKTADRFGTFCLEASEYFVPGKTYTVELSGAANLGGAGPETPDPISVGTAWLYTKYATGGYGTIGGTEAAAFQAAVWMLEHEQSWNASNTYIADVLAIYGTEADAKENYTGTAVRVMNLTKYENDGLAGTLRQDMLVYVPDGGLTLGMLGAGLLGLVLLRRRIA